MNKSWATLRKRFGKVEESEFEEEAIMPRATPFSSEEPASQTPQTSQELQPSAKPPLPSDGSLDMIGQKNELIRVRFANLVDRLEEIRSLRDDFTAMTEPVFDLMAAYPQVRSRLLETEAVLRQEQDAMAVLRREMADLTGLQAQTADELSATAAQLRKAEAKLREQDASIEDLRLNLKDREAVASDLENQLAVETERARSIMEENHALRLEAQEADQAVARAERELIEMRERAGLLDHEVRRLQKVTEEQNYRLSGHMKRQTELEAQFEAARQRVTELESKVMAEQAARQRVETQMESERSAHQSDLSSLDLKMEGLTSRLAATDKILAHTRDQLRDKNEALRNIERVSKETAIEKNTLDRRLAATQQELERQTGLVAELQRSRMELQERLEMLNKALAAKDFQVESADNKAAALSERMDQMTKRFEQERNTLEAINRRLTEELQSEKAERAMLQGALEIARESRAKIQNKYVALRKKTRLDAVEDEGVLVEDEPSEIEVQPIKAAPAAE